MSNGQPRRVPRAQHMRGGEEYERRDKPEQRRLIARHLARLHNYHEYVRRDADWQAPRADPLQQRLMLL